MTVISQSKIRKIPAVLAFALLVQIASASFAVAQPIVIQAVGDIMLGGRWERVVAQNSYAHSFEKISEELRAADITFANLEAPLTRRGREYQDKKFRFRADPLAAKALKDAGITLVTLANNHIMDYGPVGLSDTVEALRQAGIDWIGAGENLAAARSMMVYSVRDTKVALIGYSLTLPTEFWAGKNRAGTLPVVEKQLQADISAAKKEAQIVIVTIHWGEEGVTRLRPYQPRLAKMMIDSGADVVVGHHPHVLQGIERYKNGIIFYSLGNFAFASKGRSADRTLLVRLSFEGAERKAELLPVNIRYKEVGFQPTRLAGDAAAKVVSKIRVLPPGDPGIQEAAGRFFIGF